MFLETVGAICIILGLFTRFFAAALAIELGIAFLVVHLPKGFAAARGGYEYVLLLGIAQSRYAAAVPIRSTARSARSYKLPQRVSKRAGRSPLVTRRFGWRWRSRNSR